MPFVGSPVLTLGDPIVEIIDAPTESTLDSVKFRGPLVDIPKENIIRKLESGKSCESKICKTADCEQAICT